MGSTDRRYFLIRDSVARNVYATLVEGDLLLMKCILLLILTCCIFFIVGIATIYDYGINEDNPGHFIRGQVYLQRLTTGSDVFDQPLLPSPLLYIPGQRISTYKLSANENALAPLIPIASYIGKPTVQEIFGRYQEQVGRQSFYKNNAWSTAYEMQDDGGHPPISDLLATISNKIFFETFGLLGDIESYHVYILVVATLGLFVIGYFALIIWGIEASLITALSLALYPFFFAESHFNIKDIPELSFFAISIISFYFWVTSKKTRWFVIFFIGIFLAIGTKLNSAFLPFILLPWLFTIRKSVPFKRWFNRKLVIYACIVFAGTLGLLIWLWPYLWDNTFEKLFSVLSFYARSSNVDTSVQIRPHFILPFGIDLRSILYVVSQTPLGTLLLFFVGIYCSIAFVLRKKHTYIFPYNEQWLLFFWLGIPLLRVIRPGADIFGSFRQYAEFLPALALLCGIGGAWLIAILSKYAHISRKITTISFITLYAVVLIWNVVIYHPNENLYFNSLFGGLKGVNSIGLLDWQTSYDNPYRQGINWLNAHAEKNTRLAYLDGTMQAIPSIWLRGDIHFGSFFSGFGQKGEYIISAVYPQPPQVFAYLYMERFLKPVYEVKVDGVAVLKIWKNSSEFVYPDMKNIHTLTVVPQQKGGNDKIGAYWEIDLGKEYKLTSLTLQLPSQACSKRNGYFVLSHGYLIPERRDISTQTSVFNFPAEPTTKIRFYPIVATCFFKSSVQQITSL